MDPSLQITIAAFGSVVSTLVALAIVAMLVRLLGEQQDTEILREIRLLRDEVRGYGERVNNFIIFDHTANRIVGDVAGTVGPEGEVTKFRPFGIEGHTGHRVRLLAILSDGKEARLF